MPIPVSILCSEHASPRNAHLCSCLLHLPSRLGLNKPMIAGSKTLTASRMAECYACRRLTWSPAHVWSQPLQQLQPQAACCRGRWVPRCHSPTLCTKCLLLFCHFVPCRRHSPGLSGVLEEVLFLPLGRPKRLKMFLGEVISEGALLLEALGASRWGVLHEWKAV